MSSFKNARVVRLVIRADSSYLNLMTDEGKVSIDLDHENLKAIAHIIADGFKDFANFNPETGFCLEPVSEASAHLESIPKSLGLEEKLVLTVKSEGGTTIRQRLDPDRAESWLEQMDLARARRKTRQ